MSYRVGTPNYNLPQTEGSDKRDWADTNQAFLAVDTALKTASDNASSAGTAASAAQSSADAAMTTATNAQTAAGNAQTSATTAGELAQAAKSRADSAYSKAESAETAASNASAKVGDLSSLTTTDKSSTVGAINEVNTGLSALTKNDLGAKSDITINTASAVLFTAPSDGYLSLVINAGGECMLRVFGANNYTPEMSWGDYTDSTHFIVLDLFIKKGMRVRGLTNTGSNTLSFYPLV